MDNPRANHVELILQQVNALPTLPTVATRLLSLTADDSAHVREVVDLITTDPALTAKVLSLCRSASLGLRGEIMTIDRAVTMLGFNAIRNAVLSMKVFDTFGTYEEGQTSPEDESNDPFHRQDFWRHCVAVAVAAEDIAKAHPDLEDLNPADAFVCGLLHDIGKLALAMVLPKSYVRVIELTEMNQGDIAEFERRIIGLDHHTAGKRLAEQWHLPHRLQDSVWLHGADPTSLPNLDHQRLIGLIHLADLIARKQHIGFSGNYQVSADTEKMTVQLGLNPQVVQDIEQRLIERVEARSGVLGLGDTPSRQLFYDSIQRANEELGQLNSALERRSRLATQQSKILDAIKQFHITARPGRSVQDVIHRVIQNAAEAIGEGFFAMVWQPLDEQRQRPWLICQYGSSYQPVHSELIQAPPHTADLAEMDPNGPAAMNLVSIIPWVADYLVESPDVRKIQLLPLSCGWGTAAILLHDRQELPPWSQLAALTHCWGAAIAAAAQHEGAKRLGEQLAQANLALAQAQDKLLRNESMARLGEMAAGAAHEMNNPLAVISGRSQLLARSLPEDSLPHKHAQTIVQQAHRLSNLITALKLFSEPHDPQRQRTDLSQLLENTIEDVRNKLGQWAKEVQIQVDLPEDLPELMLDPEQIQQAIGELIQNALEASPKTAARIHAHIQKNTKQLQIEVEDHGPGMDPHTLQHAMDPFFSAKPAGRQVGMGLTRASQLAIAHGGEVGLCSTPGKGTVATLSLPLDSA